jgi:hypothetical protein
MNVEGSGSNSSQCECKDLERILQDEKPEELRALERHAAGCAACGEELRLWKQISEAAPSLRKTWESPDLWPRIHQTLAEESQRKPERARGAWWPAWAREWQFAVVTLLLVAISAGSTYWLMRRLPERGSIGDPVVKEKSDERLLNEEALREVEKNETAYMASIEKLAQLAQPKVQQASTPLMLSYREKLMVLDAAINELRAQVEQNRFNAHLRREMLSLYQDKQRTLEAVIREE